MTVFHWIIFAVSVLLFAASALTVAYPVFFGLSKTHLTDKYTWGLNIQGFSFLSAAACGILGVMSIFIIFFHFSPEAFELASTIAFACLISAQMLMLADLGKPFRAVKIITSKKFTSPLTLDFISLAFLTVLSFVYMFGIFMDEHVVLRIWAYATLFFVLLCLLAHVLLFVLRTPPGLTVRSFDALTTVSYSIWAGAAAISLIASYAFYREFFFGAFLTATLFVFATQTGVLVSAPLTRQKPHNLISVIMAFIVLLLLAGRGIVLQDVWLLDVFTCILALSATFIEKVQTVLNYQKPSILPAPYGMSEQEKPYRPSFQEIGNLIAGFALIVCIVYAVIILKAYTIPWIFG